MADVLCYDDLDVFGRDIDSPLVELEQDVVHLLLEAFGSNPDARTRGVGLSAALSGPENPGLRHLIETRLVDDARIDAATVTLTAEGASTTRIQIAMQVNESELALAFVVDGNGNVARST